MDEKGWGAEWSPDGTRVTYSRGGNLYLFDLIEGTISPIIDVEKAGISKIEWNFCWSQDSRRIAFKAITKDNRQVLAIVETEGGPKGVEIAYEGMLGPAIFWQPNQNEVLIEGFVEGRQYFYSLFRVNLDAPGKADRMPSRPVDRRVRNPAFSPDGKKLAVCIYRKEPGDE